MVDDQSTESLIRWSLNGDSFLVENHEEFAQSVLPRFFKHNTFSSFVRQLNMYDFHKVPVIQQGALATDPKREIWEFKHSNFQRGRQELLASVTRKRNKDKDQPNNKQIDLPTLIGDMSAIKQRQSDIMESLHTIRTDNERIWKEALDLRKKYKRQQDITIKVLQFLSLQFRGHHTHLQDTLLDLQSKF
ncbi:hypothetical protein K501DRAFT_293204 [Backusella circina FSU 941]|nr:hypothetical protein K501DRAFT_293204 [Backusella circina FSU 941]